MPIRNRRKDFVQILTRTATVQTTDIYGNEDEEHAEYWETGELIRCFIAPVSSVEDEVDRETLSRQYDVYLDPDVVIDGTSRVVLYADTDEPLDARVIGEPQKWPTAMRGFGYKTARVEVISGV